mgnify:CR=1 FL=1
MELALKVVLWLVAALLFSSILNMFIGTSYYKPITTTAGSDAPNIFVNKSDITCVPGPSENADYYTDESGGGLCGGMDYVHRMGQGYAITEGIGEPLLSM